MAHSKNASSTIRGFGFSGILFSALLLTASSLVVSAQDRKVEAIDATAMGTSTQMGRNARVRVTIYEFSTEEDRAILQDAFKQGKQQGLVNALTKMKSVGRIAITGTIGYDLS